MYHNFIEVLPTYNSSEPGELIEMAVMKELKELMKLECDYPVDDHTLDKLLEKAELIKVGPEECIVEAGQFAPDVWIVKKGIIRLVDMDGNRERTSSFALPGTLFMLKHSFVKDLPSYFEMWSCCETELLKVSRKHFKELLKTDLQFTVWMFHYVMEELFFQEKKHSSVSNGTASERFNAICRHRPDLMEKVKQKHLASYLGISPEYFCRLKRKIKKNTSD